MTPDLISRASLGFYKFWHGRLHLPGAGWLLRRIAHVWPGLQQYPFPVPDVGTALLDMRDFGAFALVNLSLGDRNHDEALLRAFSIFLKPGENLWDIGANIGYLAQSLLRPPFQLGRLDAFEPSPVALKTLSSLFKSHPRAHVHGIALGGANTAMQMQVPPAGSQLGSLVRDLPGGQRVTVPVRRGDDYQREANLPLPHVIKIDVEGFEPQVMAGLAETIAEARPIIIFEHIWLEEKQIRDLARPDYEIVFLLDDGQITRDFARRQFGANTALIPNEKIGVLAQFSAQ